MNYMMDLTREQIEKMEAGRDLDSLIAKHVMGWQRQPSVSGSYDRWTDEHGKPQFIWSDVRPVAGICWRPSQDIAAAWRVVEAMKDKGYLFDLENHMSGGWLACFWPDLHDDHPTPHADTAPLAVCRAALLALIERHGRPDAAGKE